MREGTPLLVFGAAWPFKEHLPGYDHRRSSWRHVSAGRRRLEGKEAAGLGEAGGGGAEGGGDTVGGGFVRAIDEGDDG